MFKTKTDMKKKYFAPEMEIVDINMNQQLLTESLPTSSTPTDPEGSDAPQFYW